MLPRVPLALLLLVLAPASTALRAAPPGATAALVGKYCVDCHDAATKKGDVVLEGLDSANPAANADLWERVVRKLDHRQMPPIGEPRPDGATYDRVVAELTAPLDRAATAQPNPGRTDTFRRLNRTEYQNAIRDLLGVEIDATALLPNDEPSHGFDNVTLGNLSPTLLERTVSAAQKIARLAVGTPRKAPGGETFRIRPDLTQEDHVEGLPLGTRGGGLFHHVFPLDGDYEIQLRLQRDRNEQVEGLKKPHEVEVLIDRERVALATVKPPGADKNAELVDAHLKFRVAVKAGPHEIGATFPKNNPTALLETEREPFLARFNMHRHPRTNPALYQLSITGPFDAKAAGDTPSRRAIFGEHFTAPTTRAEEDAAARAILGKLVRRAFRRPATDDDLRRPLEFFHAGSAEGAGFEAGIENAVAAILVSPQFLIRIESDPAGLPPHAAYRVSELELASRLSFFLWSSLPDDALLDAAARGDLRDAQKLEAQVRRMLADPRARNLVTNFAAQWLHLRGLDAVTPDLRRFIDFDDNLRQAMRQETELFFESILREDRSVNDLIRADYTFVNERLARHYGIPHIYGSHFRRVTVGGALRSGTNSAEVGSRGMKPLSQLQAQPESQRGGLLRQASILTVTSYATRTSPVIRGKWILDNFLGTPPPPPAPDVPALDENVLSAKLPIRERLAAHRAKAACASCHNLMDPIGFALEHYDAVGHWRDTEEHKPVDASGGWPDGSTFVGVAALERALLQRPELFAGAVTEKLLVFALGRGVAPADAPAVREIVRRARADDYRLASLILGVVHSTPFQMRRTP